MKRDLVAFVATGPVLALLLAAGPAFAQKSGGILRVPFFDSPASVSLHEESTFAALRPMMGVFNNLVMYKQDAPQNSMESIVPDLAMSWSWNEDGTELTFPLRQGVKWHDGTPFAAKDVKCTWDMLAGKAGDALRLNPRKSWYANLDEVTTKGDDEVTFHLKRPQPSFLAFWPETRITGRKAGRILTVSNIRSSKTCRRAPSPLWPAKATCSMA